MITIEEIKSSYMFRIIKRGLMKEYPWIKEVTLDEKDFEEYRQLIFLDVKIDPYELGKERGWEVARWVVPGYEASTLTLYFKGNDPAHRELIDEVNDFVDEVRISPAIPDDLKLPPPKNSWVVSGFISI